MSKLPTDQELLDISKELIAEKGMTVDGVNVYRDPSQMATVVQVYKRTMENGKRNKYGFEAVLRDTIVEDGSVNHFQYFSQHFSRQLESLQEEFSMNLEVNSHQLQFYMTESFRAVDYRTGEEWDESGPVVQLPNRDFGPIAEGELFPRDEVELTEHQNIPEHLKEKMMFYVVGWALEYDPFEWKDFRKRVSDAEAEKFK